MAATIRSIYSHWSTDLAKSATITVTSGATETDYGVELLTDDNPAHVMKATGTALTLLIDFGSKKAIGPIALIHTTLEATDDVILQGNDTNVWTSPNYSAAWTQAGWVGTGTTRWPKNSWFNAADTAGFDVAGYRYLRIRFGSGTALAQNLQIGQLRIEPVIRNFLFENAPVEWRRKPIVESKTSFEISTIYSRGTTRWGFSFDTTHMQESVRAALKAQWEDVDGRTNPWLFIPDGTENCAYLVRWATPEQQITRVFASLSKASLIIEEVGRGLRPGT